MAGEKKYRSQPPNMFRRDANRVPLDQYAISGPNQKEAPGMFMVRRWVIGDQPDPVPDQDFKAAPSLEEARKLVPFGYHCIERAPDDDVSLVEVWV